MTLGERSKEEPKRLMEEGLRSVSSNYLICPGLCRICNNFSESNSTHPYKCVTGHSDHVGHKSKKEGFKQYDDCRYFRQKEIKTEINIVKNNEKILQNDEKIETQEIEVKNKPESIEKILDDFEIATCFVCGKKNNLKMYYSQHFHTNCLNDFENSEKGKKWIIDYKNYHNEYAIKKIVSQQGNEFWDQHIKQRKYNTHIELFIEFMGIKHDDVYSKIFNKNLFLDVDIEGFEKYLENKYNKIKGELK